MKYIVILMLLCNSAFSQIQISQFNAEWNKANEVPWVMELKDCKTISIVDIGRNSDLANNIKLQSYLL